MTGQLELFGVPDVVAVRRQRRVSSARAVPPSYYGTRAYGWAYSPKRGRLLRVRNVAVGGAWL